MLGSIINLLYPAICHSCGKKTIEWNKNLCSECIKKIEQRLPPFCIKCGKQLVGEPDMIDSCSDCKKDTLYFDRAWSVCHYDGIIKELVHNFKYKKTIGLAKEFSDIILNFMGKYNIAKDAELVASIPMHPKRLFEREINQSDILAKNIAKRLRLAYTQGLLKKTKYTPLQSKLKRNERIKNLWGSFRIKNGSLVKNKNILLIDDIFTTGSTVNECAKILKKAGARYIEVVTLARGDRIS